jgi:hypothetical protein
MLRLRSAIRKLKTASSYEKKNYINHVLKLRGIITQKEIFSTAEISDFIHLTFKDGK